MTRLEQLATAIKNHEGWIAPGENPKYPEGSKAYRNNNPGNLRFDEYRKTLGADYEALGFSHFPSFEIGWKALLTLLSDSIQGKRKGLPYSKEQTLPQFFGVYSFVGWKDQAKGIRNDNFTYSGAVADELGIDINTKMGWFLEGVEAGETAESKLAKIKEIVNS